jgi:hypothetical protein
VPVGWQEVRELCTLLPGAAESTSYGTPAFKIRKRLMVRLHQDGDKLVLRSDLRQRDALIAAKPAVYSFTEHYRDYPYVLADLAALDRSELDAALRRAWELTVTP